jgi:hypothetical protein
LVDVARALPARVRSDRLRDVSAELRAIARLDRDPSLARRADLRIGAISDGSVTLLAPVGADTEHARTIVLSVPGIVDVRAVDPTDPPLTGSDGAWSAATATGPTAAAMTGGDAAGR